MYVIQSRNHCKAVYLKKGDISLFLVQPFSDIDDVPLWVNSKKVSKAIHGEDLINYLIKCQNDLYFHICYIQTFLYFMSNDVTIVLISKKI